MTKRENAIIFVDKERILFYTKKATNTLELKLPPDALSDIEIVNREKFDKLIENVFTLPLFKGKEFEVTIIFSPKITYEKEIEAANSKEEFEQTQKFLDMVPFEEVLSNSYRINKGKRVVAVNKILYNILKQSLEKNKAYALLVLPMSILSATNPELKNKIDFSFIDNKLESFRQYSLIDLEELGLGGEVTNSIGIKRKDVRLYILVAIMGALLLILFILIYTTFINVPKKVIKKPVPVFKTKVIKTDIENNIASQSSQVSTPSAEINSQ